ncbi:MAG: hypothetical protein U9Q97_04540 [Acidobacteriota bacterium]|nr:hypothetical protein [Acidobacteriota bacterium]
MNKIVDRTTLILTTSIDVLFIGQPMRTALGVLTGVTLHVVLKGIMPLFTGIPHYFDLSGIEWWELVIVGVTVLHIPTIVYYLSKRGTLIDENLEKGLEIINNVEGIDAWEKKRLYLELTERVLEKVVLKSSTQEEIKQYLEKEVKQ